MNFNLVEMYNGLLRFNKHILNELAEGLKHLPNLDGVSKGDSLIINEQGNPAWGSAAFIPTFENGLIPPLDGSDGIVQTYWTAEHNIGNGSTNGDHYYLGFITTDESNSNTYPAVYRGILNFFGDIWTFVRDVVIINRNANYNSVYLLKKRC